MADAITPLPAQAVALIKEGTPRPQTPNPTISATPAVPAAAMPVTKPVAETITPAKPKPLKPASEDTEVLVSLTIRVPKSIPHTLVKASADRKLKKIKPCTQQDIVAEAVTAWFQKNGYQL